MPPASNRRPMPGKRVFLVCLCLSVAAVARGFDHTYRDYQDSVLAPFIFEGRVDYDGLALHRAPLEKFLDQCAAVPFADYKLFTREEKIAFLVNLYNAATLKLVLDHEPLQSVQDIGGLFSSPWTTKFIRLFDHTIGLGQILHDILRPEFQDPRIHFALANACLSGPALCTEAYVPERLDKQLNEQAETYLLKRPDLNHFEHGTLYLSPLFKWYGPDFGKQAGLLAFAAKYFNGVSASTPIVYTNFDWSLNKK
jgi:hypothetical protein